MKEKENKRKEEKRPGEVHSKKSRRDVPVLVGQYSLPALQKAARSYARNAKRYSRCYLGICLSQNSKNIQSLLYTSV